MKITFDDLKFFTHPLSQDITELESEHPDLVAMMNDWGLNPFDMGEQAVCELAGGLRLSVVRGLFWTPAGTYGVMVSRLVDGDVLFVSDRVGQDELESMMACYQEEPAPC